MLCFNPIDAENPAVLAGFESVAGGSRRVELVFVSNRDKEFSVSHLTDFSQHRVVVKSDSVRDSSTSVHRVLISFCEFESKAFCHTSALQINHDSEQYSNSLPEDLERDF